MTDPRALLDAYASQGAAWDEDEQKVSRYVCAPQMHAALRAVLDKHKPETQLVWPDPDAPKDAPMGERLYCVECSHYQGSDPWPCPTVQAIRTALEGK